MMSTADGQRVLNSLVNWTTALPSIEINKKKVNKNDVYLSSSKLTISHHLESSFSHWPTLVKWHWEASFITNRIIMVDCACIRNGDPLDNYNLSSWDWPAQVDPQWTPKNGKHLASSLFRFAQIFCFSKCRASSRLDREPSWASFIDYQPVSCVHELNVRFSVGKNCRFLSMFVELGWLVDSSECRPVTNGHSVAIAPKRIQGGLKSEALSFKTQIEGTTWSAMSLHSSGRRFRLQPVKANNLAKRTESSF